MRNFQTEVTSTGTAKPMRMSFLTEGAARADITRSLLFASTDRGQAAWGSITGAAIINKITGERITII
jgi:hypothetical protein